MRPLSSASSLTQSPGMDLPAFTLCYGSRLTSSLPIPQFSGQHTGLWSVPPYMCTYLLSLLMGRKTYRSILVPPNWGHTWFIIQDETFLKVKGTLGHNYTGIVVNSTSPRQIQKNEHPTCNTKNQSKHRQKPMEVQSRKNRVSNFKEGENPFSHPPKAWPFIIYKKPPSMGPHRHSHLKIKQLQQYYS